MGFEDINTRVCQMIKSELTDIAYSTWVKYLEKAYMEENNIVIKVPDSFVQGIVQSRYLSLYHSAYSHFRDGFRYEDILVEVDENLVCHEKIVKNNIEENKIKIYSANKMREIADRKNAEIEDVEKLFEEELKEIYDRITYNANVGKYKCAKILKYPNTHIIVQKIIDNLIENGYKIEIEDYAQETGLTIEW